MRARTDYTVNITSTHPLGTNNHRLVDVTVTDSSAAFVTTWDATSSPYTVSIAVVVQSGGTLYIDWGDNSTDTVTANGTQSHTYTDSGEYQVSMTGGLSGINLGAADSTEGKLASIDQWGKISWATMAGAFQGCVQHGLQLHRRPRSLRGYRHEKHVQGRLFI